MTGATTLATLLGTWGKPVDRPALWALGVALVLAAVAFLPRSTLESLGVHTALPSRPDARRRVVVVLAFVAAFLSLGYVAYYLRGGPRIIDATSYFLEGRVLSHGHLSWTVPSPSESFRGRFLLFREPNRLAVIFPPGFPLLLAFGFLVRAPLVVGPLLAAAIVLGTYVLARELADGRPDGDRHAIGILAAALSVVCVALRYHTADTMAHGASALGVTLGLAAAFIGSRSRERGPWLLAGLAVGWVICTRPVSSFAIGAVVLVLATRHHRIGAVLLGCVPGVLFLLVASHAQTGSWFTSPQAAYYATSDGPPGCFRYGFGAGVGCLEEHKDFVLARLPHGYGLAEALLTTLRRLRIHLFDVANLEPLALLVLVPLGTGRRRADSGARRARLAFVVVLGQVLAYAPFYFDGDYPGGGARFFADVLPIEHALLAVGVACVLPHLAFLRRALSVVALALLGFAVHGAFEHEALANRDGGHPFYDVEEARAAGKGLLFFDSDHGFDLAYDPYADSARDLLAVRSRGDDHDRLVVERYEHPQAHTYRNDPPRASVVAWTAKGASRDFWRFEAEADWPPIAQSNGWAEPAWASNSCAMSGRVLTLHPEPGTGEAHVTLELPVPHTGKWIVLPRIMRRGGAGHARLQLIPLGRASVPGDAKLVWEWDDRALGAKPDQDTCADLSPLATEHGVELDATGARWELTATGGDVTIDATTLKPTR